MPHEKNGKRTTARSTDPIMGRITMQVRRLINEQLEDSLCQYDKWKLQPHAVSSIAGVYLEILSPAIERYIDGLTSPEKEVVELIVSGLSLMRIPQVRYIRAAGVTLNDVHGIEWEFRKWMLRICANQLLNFCPFCHGAKWSSGGSPHPRLSGTVCPHKELEEIEKLNEENG